MMTFLAFVQHAQQCGFILAPNKDTMKRPSDTTFIALNLDSATQNFLHLGYLIKAQTYQTRMSCETFLKLTKENFDQLEQQIIEAEKLITHHQNEINKIHQATGYSLGVNLVSHLGS